MEKTQLRTILTILGIVGIGCIIISLFFGIIPFIIGLTFTIIALYNGLDQFFNLREKDKWGNVSAPITPMVLAIIGVVALIFISIGSIATIGAGTIGVVTNSPDGDLYGKTVNEGWNFNPAYALSNIETIRYNTQVSEFVGIDNSDDTGGSIMVLSSDNLQIFMDFSITYHIPKDKVWEIRNTYGSDWQNVIINQTARSVPRMECANYTALDIIGSDRATIETNIAQKVTSAIERSGIVVDNLQIREIRLPQSLSNAIENKLVANQQLEQSEILLQKASIDAQAIQELRRSFDSDTAYIAYLQALALTDPNSNVEFVYLPYGTNTTVPVKT